MRLERDWCEIDVHCYITWWRLRGKLRCAIAGHAELSVLGHCRRCGTDILHLPQLEKITRAQRALNEHMAEHLEYSSRQT